MPIISKETWDKFEPREKEKIRQAMKEIPNEKGSVEALLIELFGKENLQPQPLTYEDVARELFGNKKFMTVECHFTSYKQAKKLLAINKLLNVAKFLNGDWKPDWSNDEDKWSLCVDPDTNKVRIIKVYHSEVNRYVVYFRTEELAKKAIQILGEDTVRLALITEY